MNTGEKDMDTKRLKRVLAVILCIACLIPTMTSFAAEMCPKCRIRSFSIVEVLRKHLRRVDANYHAIDVTARLRCGNCRYVTTRTTTTKQKHGNIGDWQPDGSVYRWTCGVCGYSETKPRNLTISNVFGPDDLYAPMSDSDYVSAMKNAIRNWANKTTCPGYTDPRDTVAKHHKGFDDIVYLDGGDRNFGNETRYYVQWFQRIYGLEDDGIVGPDTKSVLLPYAAY